MNTWAEALATWLLATPTSGLPPDVLRAASRATLDTVACAFGGLQHPAALSLGNVLRRLGGAEECSLIGQRQRTSELNAILYNGTLIRALDCNDFFLDNGGILGHPSDNIAVALAFAERQRSSGPEYLRSVAFGYELGWRLMHFVLKAAPGYTWDHVSASGLVGAAMAGLLLRLDREQLAQALAIGGAQTYSLSILRRGEISMLKAAANAITAQVGALGALLAQEGMRGPTALFEAPGGLLSALGLEPSLDLLQSLASPVDHWHILDAAVKQFPAISTSQSAIAAALEIVRQHRPEAAEVERVEVRFADLPITRQHLADADRADPQTRETADHSIPFLIAVAIEDSELGPAQFADERWLNASTRELMRRVQVLADPELNAYTSDSYPAVVTLFTKAGKVFRQEMLRVPGSPANPLSDEALGEKLSRLAGSALPVARRKALQDRLLRLDEVRNMSEATALLRGY